MTESIYFHKQFTLNTTETKLLNEFLDKFFDVTGISSVEIYTENDNVIVEIQGKKA